MYKITEERPDSGQYVAVWNYNDKPWSSDFRIHEGKHYYYNKELDTWMPVTKANDIPSTAKGVTYLQMD